MAHFYGQGSTASRLKPLRGGSLPFSSQFTFYHLVLKRCFMQCFFIIKHFYLEDMVCHSEAGHDVRNEEGN